MNQQFEIEGVLPYPNPKALPDASVVMINGDRFFSFTVKPNPKTSLILATPTERSRDEWVGSIFLSSATDFIVEALLDDAMVNTILIDIPKQFKTGYLPSAMPDSLSSFSTSISLPAISPRNDLHDSQFEDEAPTLTRKASLSLFGRVKSVSTSLGNKNKKK